jgi:tetratricopeptide (TPR) repeat protein
LRELAARLSTGHPLDELALGGLDVRTTFAVSYQLLPALPRRAFRLVGLTGMASVTEWVVAALLGESTRDADVALEALVAAGLLTADSQGQPRYHLHDLVREFSCERAQVEETPEQRDSAVRRLVKESLTRLRRAALERVAWLPAERDTLLAVALLAAPEAAAELAIRLAPFLVRNGLQAEAVRLLRDAVERAPTRETAMLARLALADVDLDRGRFPQARNTFQLAFDHFNRMDAVTSAAYALTGVVACDLLDRGDRRAAVECFAQCLDFVDRHGHPVWRARVLRMLEATRG